MPARVRLTRDGEVRVKVPGRKREIFEVLFLDEYRRKAFRNLRFVLARLNLDTFEEIPVKRAVNINYEEEGEAQTHQLRIRDEVLNVLLNPSPQIQELCPSLKRKCRMLFRYNGRGIFDLSTCGNISEEEEEDIEKFVRYVVKPQYMMAFINDSALQSGEVKDEEVETEERSLTILDENKIKTSKPIEPLGVEAETRNERKDYSKKAAENKLAEHIEESLTLQDIEEQIRCFRPEGFRESVAYERYLQALSSSPEKEEDIERVFYELVVRKKDFQDFYYQLYGLAPKLLEQNSTVIYM